MKKKEIEEKTEALVLPIAEENGVVIYDVEFVKEAGEYYLRVFIDKDGGVNINDCVAVNHALSGALDEADFIAEGYTLEVSSPGLGRRLTRDRHLERSIGKSVDVKLYKPLDGQKEFTGILKSYDTEQYILETEESDRAFARKDVAVIRLTLDL